MKLYTELDITTAILQTIFACKITTHDRYKNNENIECDILGQLTPIELPSDEEISQNAPTIPKDADDYLIINKIGFVQGAKWMKQQILNQNK